MPPRSEEPTFSRRLREGIREHRFALAITVFAVGLFLSVIAAGDLTPLSSVAPFPTINRVTDRSASGGVNYNLAFIIIGPIVALIGAYLFGAYLWARRRFEHLMRTKSKAEFLRNLDQIEEILWDLTPADEERYLAKRAEFRLR